jgi:hypothetical protein
MDATQPRWTATVDPEGARLSFAALAESVYLTREDLLSLLTAMNLELLQRNEPWADMTGAPSVEVGGKG